jgi:DNA-binding XRE family transcriptional regulator
VVTKEKENILYKNLGSLIQTARKKANLNQEDVAKNLGLSRISIVNIEHGRQKIQLHTLIKLILLLNTDINELLQPLFVIIKNSANQKAEKSINEEIDQFDNKENATKILKGFMTYSQLKQL